MRGESAEEVAELISKTSFPGLQVILFRMTCSKHEMRLCDTMHSFFQPLDDQELLPKAVSIFHAHNQPS